MGILERKRAIRRGFLAALRAVRREVQRGRERYMCYSSRDVEEICQKWEEEVRARLQEGS